MGNVLNDYRLAHGLTYAELGFAAGYRAGTAFKHCQGRIAISGDAAIRYSRALGISLDLLYPANSSADNAGESVFKLLPQVSETTLPSPTPPRDAA